MRRGTVPQDKGGRSIQFELVVTSTSGLVTKEVTVRQQAAPVPSSSEQVVFRQSGTGSATTAAFTIAPNADVWTVDWAYNCGSTGGDFTYYVYSGGAPDINDTGALDLNSSGSGSNAYSDTGTFYFQVPTACSWAIEVSELLSPPVSVSTTSNVSGKLSSSVPGIDQSGGAVTLRASVHGGKSCTFITAPKVAGIDGTVPCSNGVVTRQGQVSASSSQRTIDLEVVITGATGLKAVGIMILQRAPQTLLSTSGSGSTTTASFVVPATDTQWTLAWTADCTGQIYGNGYMFIFVNNSNNGDEVDQLVTGTGSQTVTYTDTGTFSLNISTSCNWTVSVTG